MISAAAVVVGAMVVVIAIVVTVTRVVKPRSSNSNGDIHGTGCW